MGKIIQIDFYFKLPSPSFSWSGECLDRQILEIMCRGKGRKYTSWVCTLTQTTRTLTAVAEDLALAHLG